MLEVKKCYDFFGLDKRATDEEVRKAFKKKASKYHPDLHPGDQKAAEQFKRINNMYRCIMENRKNSRKKFSVSDVIKSKIDLNTEKDITYSRGSDIYTSIEITFEESILGCIKNTQIYRLDKCICGGNAECLSCEGTGKIRKKIDLQLKVPKGVYNGQIIKIHGKGNFGQEGGEYGDLIITVYVKKNDYYTRNGMDILTNTTISYPDAVLGTLKVIKTVRGDVELDIPSGITHGSKLRLTGRGVINEKTGEVGDQIVTVLIDVPKSITLEQEELLIALQRSLS